MSHAFSTQCDKGDDRDMHRDFWNPWGGGPKRPAGASKGFQEEVPSGMNLRQRVVICRGCAGVSEVAGPA